MPKPGVKDIDLYCGDRYELFFRVYQMAYNNATGKYERNGGADLTGWTPTGVIKKDRKAATAVMATWACSLADQTNPDTRGGVLCILTPAESAKVLEPGVYDIQLQLDATHVTTWLTGAVAVTLDVTPNA